MHWSFEDHKNWYPNNFDNGMVDFVIEKLRPHSVLEFGCGIGDSCHYLSEAGVPIVHGIEPEPMDPEMFKNEGCRQFVWDITTQEEPEGILPEYDMILSIEVMEHVDRKFHEKVFNYLASKNPRVILFSAATPGQGGHCHIAERVEKEWISEWNSRMFAVDDHLTKEVKESCNKRNINHKKNCIVYRPL